MMQYVSSSDDDEDTGFESLDISNDQYYRTRLKLKIKRQQQQQQQRDNQDFSSITASPFVPPLYGSKTIRHSIPAYDLWKAFFPTYLNHAKLRSFHRPQLRHFNTGPQSRTYYGFKRIPIKNLTRYIFKCHKELKNRVSRAIHNGVPRPDIVNHILRIKHAKDLSAKSGELFLFEYSEEYPPVLGQIGMASNVKNYVAPMPRVAGLRTHQINRDKNSQSTYSPSQNKPNDSIMTKLFQAQEPFDQTAKLTRQQSSIGYPEEQVKEPPPLYFCQLKAGTKAQLFENNLYRAPIFKHDMPSCDFLIIRTRNSLYVRSIQTIFTVGQTMPLSQIPQPTEKQILKFRCDLSNLFIHKLFAASDTDPPSLKMDYLFKLFPDYPRQTLRKRMSFNGTENDRIRGEYVVQQGISSYGTIPWTKRCKIITPEQYCNYMSTLAARERLRSLNYTESMINPSEEVTELEPEILAAPWNTSKAIINLMKGNSFLDLKGHLIDPTGPQREGFSCVMWSRSPTEEQQAKDARANRLDIVKGRSAPQPIFTKNPLLHKIKAEKLERLELFRKKAQLIVETQSKVLSSDDIITSSEDEDMDQDDFENDKAFTQQLNDLNRLVIGGQSLSSLNYEKEEEERLNMMADFRVSGFKDSKQNDDAKSNSTSSADVDISKFKGKILMITRTYDQNGTKIQRTEIVREPKVIALYAKHKSDNNIRHTISTERNNQSLGNLVITSPVAGRDDGLVHQHRSRSNSLGPSELCRADGIRLRISKKVLDNIRPLRYCRRESTA